MVKPVDVVIVGAPIACTDGVKDTWRQVARWAAAQLRQRYGDTVAVEYHDLFDADCPPVPDGAQLPLVVVDRRVIISGGKLSMPRIRSALEDAGAVPQMSTIPPASRPSSGDRSGGRSRPQRSEGGEP